MDQNEAKSKFRQSDELFQLGQYQDSLRVLQELNVAFPDTKNILFPMARNLHALGKSAEALKLCDQLFAMFNDPKAVELKKNIEEGGFGSTSNFSASGVPGLDTADPMGGDAIEGIHLSDLDTGNDPVEGVHLSDMDMAGVDTSNIDSLMGRSPQSASTAPIPVQQSSDSAKWVIIGACVLAAVVLIPAVLLPILRYEPAVGADGDAGVASIGMGLRILFLGVFLFLGWVLTTATCYVTLIFTGALPHNNVGENVIDVGKVAAVVVAVSFIPIIGGFLGIYIFVHAYEIGFAGCLVYIMVSLLASLVIGAFFVFVFLALGMTLSQFTGAAPALLLVAYPSLR